MQVFSLAYARVYSYPYACSYPVVKTILNMNTFPTSFTFLFTFHRKTFRKQTLHEFPRQDPIVLTKVNTFGKTCWATSHALNIKDRRYENNIPEGRYRSTASTSAPMAGAGDREGSSKAGISISISTTGRMNTTPSEMRSSNQYTKDDTPDTLSKWRILSCKKKHF